MKKDISNAHKWLEYAERDIEVAKHLLKNYHPQPLEIICFHCQQSAEKAVKSILVLNNEEVPKIHNISLLLDKISNFTNKDIDDNFYEYAEKLTPYATFSRYPQEDYIDEYMTKKAIEYGSELFNWSKELVKLAKYEEIADRINKILNQNNTTQTKCSQFLQNSYQYFLTKHYKLQLDENILLEKAKNIIDNYNNKFDEKIILKFVKYINNQQSKEKIIDNITEISPFILIHNSPQNYLEKYIDTQIKNLSKNNPSQNKSIPQK